MSLPNKEYNILLLGETGVGKSTFINAFVNYVLFKSLDEAICATEITCLIPTNFVITDDQMEEQVVKFGADENESSKAGASATQFARSYRFVVGEGVAIRVIDTPGIGDTRGIKVDEENFDRLLTVIGELEELHVICILLKPNNARLTILFEYCVKQLLSRLQKSASQNIVFVFTNSRSTFYRPGDTLTPLRAILKQIELKPPYVHIPFTNRNTFCFDNESFRFLVAKRFGICFTREEKQDFANSWEKSCSTAERFLKYVVKSTPHKIQDTVSVNEARRLILRLSEPLAHVSDTIENNVRALDKHIKKLQDSGKAKDELEQLLYVPVIKLRIHDYSEPRTVCTDASCVDYIPVTEGKSVHYKTICHNPCYLRKVPKEIVGSPELIHCDAMGGTRQCHRCGHGYEFHMHVYYTTEKFEDKIQDVNVVRNIKKEEDLIENLNKTINDSKIRIEKYKEEKAIVQKSMAEFAHFLQNNAIAAYNDKYKAYIEYLIDSEKNLGSDADKQLIKDYENLVKTYEEQKNILDSSLLMAQQLNPTVIAMISSSDIIGIVSNLYALELTGPIIRDFYEKQKTVCKMEALTATEKKFAPKVQGGFIDGFLNFIGLKSTKSDDKTTDFRKMPGTGNTSGSKSSTKNNERENDDKKARNTSGKSKSSKKNNKRENDDKKTRNTSGQSKSSTNQKAKKDEKKKKPFWR